MKTKTKALRHYGRMIKWAEKQKPRERLFDVYDREIGFYKMLKKTDEAWNDKCCAYCKIYKIGMCVGCPLYDNICLIGYRCCSGLFKDMAMSKTWGTWVKRAKLVRQYIKENG